MHIWGSLALHPLTFPVAEQVAHATILSGKYTLAVYGAVFKPTVEDFMFLFAQL